MGRGRKFIQRAVPLEAKYLDWANEVFIWGTKRSRRSERNEEDGEMPQSEGDELVRACNSKPGQVVPWRQIKDEDLELDAGREQEPVEFSSHKCCDMGKSRKM